MASPGPAAAAGAQGTAARAGSGHRRGRVAAGEPETALDPVCGMDVTVATARHIAQAEGTLYYFCSVGCRARFVRDPASHVGAGAPAEP